MLIRLRVTAAALMAATVLIGGCRGDGVGSPTQPVELLATLHGHTSSVNSVAFSPDGDKLASGGGDATVKLWDVNARREIATLHGHTDDVWSVAFSPDGDTLASGSRDNMVKLWHMAP